MRPNASLKAAYIVQCNASDTQNSAFVSTTVQQFATSSQRSTPVSQQKVLGNSIENCSGNGQQHEREKDKAWNTACNGAAGARCFAFFSESGKYVKATLQC